MADFNSQINKLVEEFVSQVTAVARQAAMDTLTAALGAAGGAARRRGGAAIALPTLGGGVVAARGGRRPKGAKRPQDEIEGTKQRVLDFIGRNPGFRIEQINRELGTATRDLALPLRKLIADGQVRTEGEKRSTQYFPGEGGGGRRGGGEGAAAPRRRKKK
jgi:hypothetical protein